MLLALFHASADSPDVAGQLAATEAPDRVVMDGGTGFIEDNYGQSRRTERGNLRHDEKGKPRAAEKPSRIPGSFDITEGQDAAALGGGAVASGALSGTEQHDGASMGGVLAFAGALVTTEAQDGASVEGDLIFDGAFASIEPFQDDASMTGGSIAAGDLAEIEPLDTIAAAAAVLATGTLDAVEPPDAMEMSGGTLIAGAVDAVEEPDTVALVGELPTEVTLVEGDLAAVENADTAALAGETGQATTPSGSYGYAPVRRHARTLNPPQLRPATEQVFGDLAAREDPDTAACIGEVTEPVAPVASASPAMLVVSGPAPAVLDLWLVEAPDTARMHGEGREGDRQRFARYDDDLLLLAA